jgi:hypothetical protein
VERIFFFHNSICAIIRGVNNNGGLEGFTDVYKEGVIIIDKVLENFIMGLRNEKKMMVFDISRALY